MQKLHQLKTLIRHWFLAVDRHSLHGQFAYDLFEHTQRQARPKMEALEQARKKLLTDGQVLSYQDMGADKTIRNRTVKSLAARSLSSPRMSSFFYLLTQWHQAQQIVELGTCLGVNTAYLSKATTGTVHTFEGIPQIAEQAQQLWEAQQLKNIRLTVGDIDLRLPEFLNTAAPIDLAFVDANHTYEATLRYFEMLLPHCHQNALLIFDDIYHSEGMTRAWEAIKNHPKVKMSFDYWRFGIVCLCPTISAKHYRIGFSWW